MPGPPQLEDCDRVLVVEGYSDLLFYAAVLDALGKIEGVFIQQINGRSDLTDKLTTFITPELLASKTAIGVIIDADTNPKGTAESLGNVLQQLSWTPVKLGGWTNDKPRIGVFITPDGASNGEIETLAWRAWSSDPANTKPKSCIDGFMECMANAGFKAQSPDKGLVGALLAVRYDEDPRLGPGTHFGKVFDLKRPEFFSLTQFLSDL
jgi:hypothetical protein